jgi:dTDP-4-dehydrorhamnose 3,5-epimerase
MTFTELELPGVTLIEPEVIEDERGSFARTFCAREFERRGLNPCVAQCNLSWNRQRGTVRGLHYQAEPFAEAKLVRCTRGALFDVVVDLRPGSPTLGAFAAVELTAAGGRMLYIPEGCAHGFQTLEDDTEVFYQISQFYHPESARGLRWDDPAFAIPWPLPVSVISAKDRSYPCYDEGSTGRRAQGSEPL